MDYIELKATIEPLEIGREVLVAQLSEIGFESFVEEFDGVNAYIQKQHFNRELIDTLGIKSNQDFKIEYTVKLIEDQNWNEVWEQSFEPIIVNDECVVRAHFHEKRDVLYDILIEPKMSFGTGHHETTYLIIERLLELELAGMDVLDMGCGTGILAILAKMKGARHVVAIDIDEWAYNNTLENIEKNKIEDVNVQLGGAELLLGMDFDLVIANINRNILLQDLNTYAKVLKEDGIILLSGFFSSDQEILLSEAKKCGMDLSFSAIKNDWTMLQIKKIKNA